jgi:putative flippase GtrA
MAVFAAASHALPSVVAAAMGIATAAAVNFVSGDRLVFRSVPRPTQSPTLSVPVAVGLATEIGSARRSGAS